MKWMPAYKNKDSGSWYVVTQYTDWTGERKQKCKRGFSTRREALEWEQKFQQQNAGDLDMSFEAFFEIDLSPRPADGAQLQRSVPVRNSLRDKLQLCVQAAVKLQICRTANVPRTVFHACGAHRFPQFPFKCVQDIFTPPQWSRCTAAPSG